MDDMLVEQAKTQAALRGKSVSRMFGEFVASLKTGESEKALPPLTNSLLGVVDGRRISESDYKRHLRKKYS
ncbi:MAG: hypothetical protein JW808_07830 [Victivallales bacterium]|nr:hypothetical protein [Victivallales bacterium]